MGDTTFLGKFAIYFESVLRFRSRLANTFCYRFKKGQQCYTNMLK